MSRGYKPVAPLELNTSSLPRFLPAPRLIRDSDKKVLINRQSRDTI